ncbi:cytoplasmic membrane protein [Thecamonas trahens ATCC 50062]|uniref:Cytoplasmic membrane protein n=1 Tax=Thecamonas trahens ATCC 50062 TaxID=461836 RepID=A0A0L0D9S8_THETB|nr:cytoplasmic membrane protein [Thecamonas trahens ATCC 50062]KNC49079.1 cytoplasmic membrane protein [Thecamonas trahens ATCC 50062]|eukprot:XP_013758110.1 cytoplasmic membrane protein [Thecamonas trahens ATCC 50062]
MQFIHDKVVTPVVQVMKSGTTPEAIADALGWGVMGGIFPIPGLTSLPCLLLAYLLSLNVVPVMAANFAVTPLNLASFVPIIRLGEWAFGLDHLPIAIEPFTTDLLSALSAFWRSLLAGVAAWILLLPLAVIISWTLRPVIRSLSARVRAAAEE